jgi:hypothetical protein
LRDCAKINKQQPNEYVVVWAKALNTSSAYLNGDTDEPHADIDNELTEYGKKISALASELEKQGDTERLKLWLNIGKTILDERDK